MRPRPITHLPHLKQRREARALPPRQHLQPLGHQRAVEAGQRHDVTDGGQCDEIEQIEQGRLGATGKEAGAAQLPVQGHAGEESDPGSAKLTEAGRAIKPVRVDHGGNRRRHAFGLVMIQHDHVGPPFGGSQRLMGSDAAIDADDQCRTAIAKPSDRRGVRAVAFLQPVRDIMRDLAAERP